MSPTEITIAAVALLALFFSLIAIVAAIRAIHDLRRLQRQYERMGIDLDEVADIVEARAIRDRH